MKELMESKLKKNKEDDRKCLDGVKEAMEDLFTERCRGCVRAGYQEPENFESRSIKRTDF